MNIMVRERPSRVAPTVYIAVTPQIRAALALLAEAAIDLIDEIDAPVADLEPDPDAFEDDDPAEQDDEPEDDDPAEENQDDEGVDGDMDAELGWSNSGAIGTNDMGYDADIVAPETSDGMPPLRVDWKDPQNDAELRAMFDPRLAMRPKSAGFVPHRHARLPRFPWEPASREPCETWRELGRIHAFLAQARKRRRSERQARPRKRASHAHDRLPILD